MIHFSPEVKAALVSQRIRNPHSVAWARATASLWGNVKWHELDEPARLTDEIPVRLRYKHDRGIISDRRLSLKTLHAGTHVALRFYFKNGTFMEVPVTGVNKLTDLDLTAEINIVEIGDGE